MPSDIEALQSYVKTLESKIKYLEQHHQCCMLNAPRSPPADEDNNNYSNNHITVSPELSPGLEIIPYKPEGTTSKPSRNKPRWRKSADRLLENAQAVTTWTTSIRQRKLDEVYENASIIADICGVPAQAPVLKHERQIISPAQDDRVIISARAYARATIAYQGNARLIQKLQTFRELVFVSLCAVLEVCKYPINEINETMQIYVSGSEDENLKRLRSGALWANHRIVALDTVLEENATEWFFDHGISISHYSLLAASTRKSTPYVNSSLKKKKQLSFLDCLSEAREAPNGVPTAQPFTATSELQEGSSWVPSFIPAYIKVLVGDGLSLKQICDALGYGPEYDTKITPELCNRYAILRDRALVVRKRKRDQDWMPQEWMPIPKRQTAMFSDHGQDAISPSVNLGTEYARAVDLQEIQETEPQRHSHGGIRDCIYEPNLVQSNSYHQININGHQDRTIDKPSFTGYQVRLTEDFSPEPQDHEQYSSGESHSIDVLLRAAEHTAESAPCEHYPLVVDHTHLLGSISNKEGAISELRPGDINFDVPQLPNYSRGQANETNVAKIIEINRLGTTLKEYLVDGINKSLKRKQEKDIGWARYTDTVRLHLAYCIGDDFKLEVCICSSVGREISEARLRSVEGLKGLLGDCLFDGMKASSWRKQEEEMGMSDCTGAVNVSGGDDTSDCTVEVMLHFKTGISVWAALYPQ